MLRINCNGTGCFCLSLYAMRVKVISFYFRPFQISKCAFKIERKEEAEKKPDYVCDVFDGFWPISSLSFTQFVSLFPKDDIAWPMRHINREQKFRHARSQSNKLYTEN